MGDLGPYIIMTNPALRHVLSDISVNAGTWYQGPWMLRSLLQLANRLVLTRHCDLPCLFSCLALQSWSLQVQFTHGNVVIEVR
jgi:hypothetical protein